MDNKKVTPVSLYQKDLKKSCKYKYIDIATANTLYKSISVIEKERYEIQAKHINQQGAVNKCYTTQRDTIGSNLKEVSDCKDRYIKWEKDTIDIIKGLAEETDVMQREFVQVKVGGVYFSSPNDCQSCFFASEIVFVKFNFTNGITNSLILFPSCLKVPVGYRESLYELLEEEVGWRPDTFRSNTSTIDCVNLIRDFFGGVYPPIFVTTKDRQEKVGMSLFNMYAEINQKCPWLESLQDWGQYCTIYRFDSLVANLLNKKTANTISERLSESYVQEQWLQMNASIATQCCERHQQFGLANQCVYDSVIKNLYSSFLIMYSLYKDEMPNIKNIVSSSFIDSLDFILKPESPVKECTPRVKSTHYWDDYVFSETNIEDVIHGLKCVSVTDNATSKKPDDVHMTIVSGRGRGWPRNNTNDHVIPGQSAFPQKLKLPNVTC